MASVVLQPAADDASRRNLKRTIHLPVAFDAVAHLMGPERGILTAAHPNNEAAMWGSVPHRNAIRDHDSLRPGDVVLFGGQGRFFLRGAVTAKWRNARLARELWGAKANGETWELMYSLADIRELDLPYHAFNALWRYAPNASPRSFRLLDEARSGLALQYLDQPRIDGVSVVRYVPAEAATGATDLLRRLIGEQLFTVTGRRNTILSLQPPNVIVATDRSSDGQPVPIEWVDAALTRLVREGRLEIDPAEVGYRSAFIGAVLLTLPGARAAGSPPAITLRPPGGPDESEGADQDFTFGGDLSRQISSTQRGEQSSLRQRIFGSETEAECDVCGHTYPVRFLCAAHIKKRAICTDEERRDLQNIAMAACLFGCDALFEAGYVAVDETGSLIIASDCEQYPDLAARLERLRGRAIPAYVSGTVEYFAWHRTNTFRS